MKNIIIRETEVYKLSEQLEVSYIQAPKRNENMGDISTKNIDSAFIFDRTSSLLKFYPEKEQKIAHFQYGEGTVIVEHVFTDKDPSSEIIPKKKNRKTTKITVDFPKVVKDHENENITNN